MRIQEIIQEIKELRQQPSHRSSMDIFRMLDNNRRLFLQHMEEGNLNHLIKGFEDLCDKNPKEYQTASYNREYEQAHAILSFYLDRII